MVGRSIIWNVFMTVLCVSLADRDVFNQTNLNQTFHKVQQGTFCRFHVADHSGDYLRAYLETYDVSFAPFTMNFSTNYTVEDTVIQHNAWVWTYQRVGQSRISQHLKWPADFQVLSLGLLKTKVSKTIRIDITVIPPNCSFVVGERKSTKAIANALSNMTQTHLSSMNVNYNFSKWCYLAEIPGIKQTYKYWASINFGFPSAFVRYNCCKSTYHWKRPPSERIEVTCSDSQVKSWSELVDGPYVLTWILLAYFPIAWIRFFSSAMRSSKRIDNPLSQVTDDYVPISDDDQWHETNWVYLTKVPPVNFMDIVCGLCGLAKRHPVCLSRIRRILVVLLTPTVIYLKLWMYYNSSIYDLVHEMLNHGAPLSFTSMIVGVTESSKTFLPKVGGPYCMILTFYTVGIFLIVVPRSYEAVLENGLVDFNGSKCTPLLFDLESIEKLSLYRFNDYYGYLKISRVLQARFYLVLRPYFWYKVCKIQRTRFFSLVIPVSEVVSKPILIFVLIIATPIYIVFCCIEIMLSAFIYGIPAIGIIIIGFIGLVKSFSSFILQTFNAFRRKGYFLNAKIITVKIISGIILFPVCSFLILGFFMIFTSSLNFLSNIIVFVFLAILVYPANSFAVIFFTGALLYYVCKIISGFAEVYFNLLSNAVHICLQLRLEPHNVRIEDDVLRTSINRSSREGRVNSELVDFSSEQNDTLDLQSTTDFPQLLNFKNHFPGIPYELFNILVNRYKPVHIQVFKSISRVLLILLLLFITYRITRYSGDTNSELSDVMHVVFIVAMGALPHVLEASVSYINKGVLKDVQMKRLEDTIKEYRILKRNNALAEEDVFA